MGRHKKIVEIELEKDEQIPEKSTLRQLSGKYLASFSGDTSDHAIREAWGWVESVDKDKNVLYNIVLQDFYRQKAFGGRGVIVSYNRVLK